MKHILLFLSSLALVACGEPSSAPIPETTKTVPVKIAPVTQHTESQPITTTGIIAYKEAVTLSFKIGGIVQAISVNEGDRIQKGQQIAKLSPDEITARVTQAQSAKVKAQRDLERFQKLYEDHVITKEQLQNATTALEVANAELDIAQFNQKHAVIYDPANGRILRRFAEPNELVTPGTPILHIASDEQQRVLRTGLTDRDIVQITLGDTATVTFDAYPNHTFKATTTQIAEQAHPQTGTFEIELTIADAHLLKSGFIGHATLYPSKPQPHNRIPLNAVVEADANNAIIFIPKGQFAQRLVIHPQYIAADYIAIHPNQQITQVITNGSAYLQDGSPIAIQ